MTTQTWLDRHNQAFMSPLDPHEKVLVGLMRHIDLLVVNSIDNPNVRPHTIRLLHGFLGLIHTWPSGRLSQAVLDDWARSRAGLVGLTDEDDFGANGLEFEIDKTDEEW